MAICHILIDISHFRDKNVAMNNPDQKIIRREYSQGTPGHVLDADYFYYETAPYDSHDLAIICGGYEKCAPNFEIHRSNYPYFCIKYTLKGKGQLNLNSKIHTLKPNALSGFSPGVAHHYKSDPNDPMEHIFIIFVGRQARSLLKQSTLADSGMLEPPQPSITLNIIETILEIGLEKNIHSQELCCHYLKILLLRQALDRNRLQQHSSISMSTYLKCKNYIDRNISNVSSPSQVADYFGLNVRYLANLFKKHSAIAPREYIMRLKLNKAVNLLLTSTLTIKDIGEQVGFIDPYCMSSAKVRHKAV